MDQPVEFQRGEPRRVNDIAIVSRQWKQFGEARRMASSPMLWADLSGLTVDIREKDVQNTGLPDSGIPRHG